MQVTLYDRIMQSAVIAEITAMTEHHIRLANSTWAAAFQDRYRLHEHDEDSWMWYPSEVYLDLLLQRRRLRAYAIVAGEMILGVLFLHDETHLSRLGRRQPLVYINYVATAPWNRRDNRGAGRLRGVGTALIGWATQYSHEIGCEGRLGLHSLRSSDAFYGRLCFRNFGIDAAHRGMSYFEQCDAHEADSRRSYECCSPG